MDVGSKDQKVYARLTHIKSRAWKGLGIPKKLIDPPILTAKELTQSTTVFYWENMNMFLMLSPLMEEPIKPKICLGELNFCKVLKKWTRSDYQEETALEYPIKWRPPDLTIGSEWYLNQVAHLHWVCSFYDNRQDKYVHKGFENLRIHCRNYDFMGPKRHKLQLILLEFPPEHWV